MCKQRIIDIIIPVYNDKYKIESTVQAALSQKLPKHWNLSIIIVDDGSDIPLSSGLNVFLNKRVQLHRIQTNSGRSHACNAGAACGEGDIILFLDSDCIFPTRSVVNQYIQEFEHGSDVICGSIFSSKFDFWSIYQNNVAKNRIENFNSGDHASMTTACLLVKRSLHNQIGGYNENFRHYGFEDRDYLLRLVTINSSISAPKNIYVEHNANLSLSSISQKMLESGQHTSKLMYKLHPKWYTNSSYSKVDAHNNNPLLLILVRASFLLPIIINFSDKLLYYQYIPYFIKNSLVKFVSGFSFLLGTYRSRKDK